MTATLLQLENMSVVLGGTAVVRDVTFAIAPGEKMALVGESGSGKTVTALSLLRLLPEAKISGRALFSDGRQTRDLLALRRRQMRALRGDDIAMIFQEPMTALNPLMPVGEQVAEVVRMKRAVTRPEAARAAVELLHKTGIAEPARRAGMYPHQLSGGQRQRAMIAMALACTPKLLLADEPTTALDASLRVQILDLLDALRRETGMAILMISHDLNLVRRFADRVAVMQNGRLVEQGTARRIFDQPRHPYTQRLLASKPERDVDEAPPSTAAPILEATDLHVVYPVPLKGMRGWFGHGQFVALQGADFSIGPGRTLGIIGESGSGKSTLAQAVLALLPRQHVQGRINFAGRTWQYKTATDRPLRRAVQVVFQDPFSSLSPRMTIGAIVGEGLRVHQPVLSPEQRHARVRHVLSEVGLPESDFPDVLARYPHEFSGGQRQRIALARALIVEPELLVLDEPTSALDVTIQKQVLTLLQRLQRERHLSYLLITHDVDVVRAMAHDVIVLEGGVVVESGDAAQVLSQPQDAYTKKLLQAAE